MTWDDDFGDAMHWDGVPPGDHWRFERCGNGRVERVYVNDIFVGWLIQRAPWHPSDTPEMQLKWHAIDRETAFLGYFRTRFDAVPALQAQHKALLEMSCTPPPEGVR
jgi:hypothetical protein